MCRMQPSLGSWAVPSFPDKWGATRDGCVRARVGSALGPVDGFDSAVASPAREPGVLH